MLVLGPNSSIPGDPLLPEMRHTPCIQPMPVASWVPPVPGRQELGFRIWNCPSFILVLKFTCLGTPPTWPCCTWDSTLAKEATTSHLVGRTWSSLSQLYPCRCLPDAGPCAKSLTLKPARTPRPCWFSKRSLHLVSGCTHPAVTQQVLLRR